jgi:hypothetical protein
MLSSVENDLAKAYRRWTEKKLPRRGELTSRRLARDCRSVKPGSGGMEFKDEV